MARKRQLHPSEPASAQFDAALLRLAREGFSVWGFIFKSVEGDTPADSKVNLLTFNTQPNDPIPLFIVKTENALTVMRQQAPVGFDMAKAEEAVADAVSGNIEHLPGDVKLKIN